MGQNCLPNTQLFIIVYNLETTNVQYTIIQKLTTLQFCLYGSWGKRQQNDTIIHLSLARYSWNDKHFLHWADTMHLTKERFSKEIVSKITIKQTYERNSRPKQNIFLKLNQDIFEVEQTHTHTALKDTGNSPISRIETLTGKTDTGKYLAPAESFVYSALLPPATHFSGKPNPLQGNLRESTFAFRSSAAGLAKTLETHLSHQNTNWSSSTDDITCKYFQIRFSQ